MGSPKTWFIGSAAAIAVALILTLFVFQPGMPERIVLFTGPEESAYHNLGLRFADDLRDRGLEVDVITTGGSLDNVQRLEQGGNVVAFAPSAGNWAEQDTTNLIALGSIGIQPLWLFHRADLSLQRIGDLAGMKIVTEGKGAASDAAGRKLIKVARLTDEVEFLTMSELTGETLLTGFSDKTIDAVFISGKAGSPVVETLLHSDQVKFLSIERAEAIAAHIPGVMAVTAPEGVFDLARNVPDTDSQLLAAATSLIAHEDLHPATVPMLLVTAERLNEKTPSFLTTTSFPSAEHVTLPLSSSARRYFNQGEVGLSKFLPYRVTRFLNHLGFFVLPILAVVILLLRLVPLSLKLWFGFRLKGLFKQLEIIEKSHAAGSEPTDLGEQLDRIDRATASMFVPRSKVHEYVDFRQFLHDIRDRVTSN